VQNQQLSIWLSEENLCSTTKYVAEGSTVYACFIDMSKAFERVCHHKLLGKLESEKVPRKIICMLNYIFSVSFASVEFNGHFSYKWKNSRGVRQGGALSAHLFNIYTSSILHEMNSIEHGCCIGLTKRNVQAYADDIVLFCPTSSALQKLIDKLTELCGNHDLKINYDKTKVVKLGRQDIYKNFIN